MAFARHQFEMNKPVEGDGTVRDHLEAQWKRTKVMPKELANAPAMPRGCSQLWADFIELHGSRGSTGFGAARITFADMQAWQEVRGVRLLPWDIDCIRKVDDLWLSEFAPKPQEPKQ